MDKGELVLVTGAGGFIGYFNVDDVYGEHAANYSQSVKTSLPDWANKTAAASGGVVIQQTLEKLFEIQHQLIFGDKVAISEVIVNAPASSSSGGVAETSRRVAGP